ncbi:hypothetical protein LX12_001974 [Williamsia serinedens]|uniref:DUF3558 domain-containing protein n=1 Tax=Williamsia serinedens TaxID=391736 RepID=A0ABT1H0L9_9NOCA|nr:hypothetical protein [Williamsia serinedens]
MGTRIRAVLSVGAIAVCVGLAASACGSGSTAGVETASSSASASPAFPVESLPPGVQKDSVFDLNSTKDMTGVVTTVPFGQSPYAAHLPDVCNFVPQTLMDRFGFEGKRRGFRGTQLVAQACNLQHQGADGLPDYSATIGFYTNNISEVLRTDRVSILRRDVTLSPSVSATLNRLIPASSEDLTALQTCSASWGTFFGAISVSFRYFAEPPRDSCNEAVAAAKLFVSSAPKSPSQMRAAE